MATEHDVLTFSFFTVVPSERLPGQRIRIRGVQLVAGMSPRSVVRAYDFSTGRLQNAWDSCSLVFIGKSFLCLEILRAIPSMGNESILLTTSLEMCCFLFSGTTEIFFEPASCHSCAAKLYDGDSTYTLMSAYFVEDC